MHTVVLVDDQVLFVESLRTVIQSRADDFEVVGVYYDGDTAAKAIAELRPDLVLMDVRMAGTDGVMATQKIMSNDSSARVVMLTTYDEDEYVHEAVKQGAVGYLLKDMPPDALLASMRSAINGQFQIPSKLAGKLIGGPDPGERHRTPALGEANSPVATSDDPPDWLFDLSRKERMILRLLIDGYDNQEISERVFLAPQTVKNYVSRLYGKANVDSRTHLIRAARQLIRYL